MVRQYPHRLVITTVSGSTQDGNGNWQAVTTSTIEKTCRAEPNNKNAQIKAVDGTAIVFDFTVYMPLPVDIIAVGSKVSLYNGDELLSTNTVKRFSKGQLNARLWL
jgi:hypothetical protein